MDKILFLSWWGRGPRIFVAALLAGLCLPSSATLWQEPVEITRSLRLTGSGHVLVDHDQALNPAWSITVEAWVRRQYDSNCETVVAKGYQTAWWLGFCNQTIRFYGSGMGSQEDGNTPIPANVWTHIAVVYTQGSGRRYYINGELDYFSATAESAPTSNSLPVFIGNDPGQPYFPFEGHLAHVRIWDVPRSQEDIRRYMHISIDEPLPGLVANWRLAGNWHGNFSDHVGGFHGSSVGTLTFTAEHGSPAQSLRMVVDENFNRMSHRRHGQAGVYLPQSDQALLIGGLRGSTVSSVIDQVDVATGEVTLNVGNLPQALTHLSAVYVPERDLVFTFGGATGTGWTLAGVTSIFAIDPNSGETRQVLPGLPVGLNAPGVVYHPFHQKIYIFGGRSSLGARTTVYVFDPVTEEISTLAAMAIPAARSHLGVVYSEISGHIYLLGGFDSSGFAHDQVWRVSLDDDGQSGSIVTLGARLRSPEAMVRPVADPHTGLIYLMGGYGGFWVSAFDPYSEQLWRTRMALPGQRIGSSVLFSPVGRHALVIGGEEPSDLRSVTRVPLGDGPAVPIGDWRFPSPVSSSPLAIDGSGRGVVIGTAAHGAYRWRSDLPVRTVYTAANLGSASGRVNDVRYQAGHDHVWIATQDAGVRIRGATSINYNSDILGTSQARSVDYRPGYTAITGAEFVGTGGQGLKWQRFIFDPLGGYWQWQTAFTGQNVTSITHRQVGDVWVIAQGELKRLQTGTFGSTETSFGFPCNLVGIQDLAIARNGDWWLVSDGVEFGSGLCRVPAADTPGTGSLIGTSIGTRGNRVDVDSDGRVWVSISSDSGNSGGLAVFEVSGGSTSEVRTSEYNWENAPLGSRTVISESAARRLWDSSVNAAGAVDESIWIGKPDGRVITRTERWRGIEDAHQLLYYTTEKIRMARGRAFLGGSWGFHVMQPDGVSWDSHFDIGLGDALGDRLGRTWLATSAGVRLYEPWGLDDLSDREGLRPTWNTKALAEDHDGRIWIGGVNGLTLFDRERFVVTLDSANSDLPADEVRALFVDSGNRLWVGTSNGLARLDQDRFRVFTIADGLPANAIHAIDQLASGAVVVSTTAPAGMAGFDGTAFQPLPPPHAGDLWPISVDQDGRLWAGRSVRIDDQWQTYHTTNSGLKRQAISEVIADRADRVWFAHGSPGGVSVRGATLPPLANTVPIIDSVSHLVGTAGMPMSISGSGFGRELSGVRVFIGAGEATVELVNPGQIYLRVTAENTSGPIVVQVAGRRAEATQKFCAVPTISHFSPTGATLGTEVKVYGTNFDRNVMFSTGGSERQAPSAATEFRFTVDQTDGSSPLLVRNTSYGCNQTASSDTAFRRIDLAINRLMLNQGHKSMGLAGNKPTLVQHYLTTDQWVRAGEGFDDRVEVDQLRVRLSEAGNPPRTFTVPVEVRPPSWPPPWPVATEPPASVLPMPPAWYRDMTMSLNATLTPWLDGGGPVEVQSTLLNRGRELAQITRTVDVRASQQLNVLLVPIMNNDFTAADLDAMRTLVNQNLDDARQRLFHFGRVNFHWSPMVFRANDILWDENEQVDVMDSFELYMASHNLERARRSWNSSGRPPATIAFGVVEPVANSGDSGGMAFWPDMSMLVNSLGLSALNALCDFGDAVVEFFTLGILGGDGCDIEVPLYVGWAEAVTGASSLFGHEIGHILGLVRSHAANGSPTLNPSHSIFDEVQGDGTCTDAIDGMPYDPDRTLYRSPGMIGPVVNPMTGIQYLPGLSETDTAEIDEVPVTHGALVRRGKALMSYACRRGNENTFFEPADLSHLRFELDPLVLELSVAGSRVGGRYGMEPVPTPGRRVLVSGTVDRAAISGELVRVEVLGDDDGPLDAAYQTGWLLVQRDAEGVELARQGVFPVFRTSAHGRDHGHGLHESEAGFFAATVLAADNVTHIELRYHNTLLDSFSAGPGVPTVVVTSPGAGNVYASGELPVSWKASDPDGDELSITVHYSADNGSSWRPVGFGHGSATVAVPVSVLPPSTQARIRVTASDGLNAGSATSSAFTVTARPPVAYIGTPAAEAIYLEGQRIRLSGSAWDAADDDFDETGLRWMSDRDGDLGSGAVIKTMLSVGTHQISLEATNAHGLSDLAAIPITIRGDYDGDGIADDDEIYLGFNPLWSHDVWIDYDGDGLPWIMENNWGTDPFDTDTSGSGQSDADDIDQGLDPLNPEDSLPPDALEVYPSALFMYDNLSLGTLLPHELVQLVSRQPTVWTVTSNRPWLRTLRSSGMTLDSVTVVANANQLPNGTYTGTLTFSSKLGDVAVPVTLVVEGSEIELEDPLFKDRFEHSHQTDS